MASQFSSGQYGDASDYISDLVRREQQRREAAQEFGSMLDDAVASSVSKRKVPEIMSDLEAKMRANGRLKLEPQQ